MIPAFSPRSIALLRRNGRTSARAAVGQSQRLIDVHCLSALAPIPTGIPDSLALPLSATCCREHVQQLTGKDARKQTNDGNDPSIKSMPDGRTENSSGRSRTAM
jgi:hypothetical protein